MEEKKIVFKSIDEQLAEDERKTASVERSSDKPVARASAGTGGPKRGRKKLRLKKSVRRTIGSLMLATSIVIGAIPTGGVKAIDLDQYAGSTATAPVMPIPSPADPLNDPILKISDTDVDATIASCSVKLPTTDTDRFGGFPLLFTTDSAGDLVPEKQTIGGKDFNYVVNDKGYGTTDLIRPVYVLNSNGNKIIKYMEKDKADNAYNPSGNGNLNLVVGYVKPGFPQLEWDYEDNGVWKYYRSEEVKWTSADLPGLTADIYGKRIDVYGLDGNYYKVSFVYDGTEIGSQIVKENGYVDDTKLPDTSDATKYPRFVRWKMDFATSPIVGNTIVEAELKPVTTTTSKPGLLQSIPGTDEENADGTENADESDAADTDGGVQNDNSGNGDGNAPAASGNGDGDTADEGGNDAGTNSEGENSGDPADNSAQGTEGAGTEGDLTSKVVVENIEMEKYGSAGNGLTGVLLAAPTSPYNYHGRDYYTVQPIESYYVCDYYVPISAICDSAFKDTQNVLQAQIPSTLTALGNNAFENSMIKEFTIGSTQETIGAMAFKNCTNLQSVYFNESILLNTIGAEAFGGCAILSTLTRKDDPSQPQFMLPYSVTKVGNGAFYGTGITSVDLYDSRGVTLGDYVFARCESLSSVNLDTPNDIQNIKDLNVSEGLFRECHNLQTVIMPHKFSGSLKAGTFGCCNNLSLIVFKDKNSGFADDEFDSRQIIVEGQGVDMKPDLKNSTPEGSSITAYKDCLQIIDSSTDKSNNYTYRYRESDSLWYDYCNVKATESTTTTPEKIDFVFEVRNDGMITANTDRKVFGTDLCDLVINDTVGENGIYISGIDKEVFKDNKSIVNLTLPGTISSVGQSAFEECDELKTVTVTTNGSAGTDLKDRAFAANPKLDKVTYKHGGDALCAIRSACFKDCPELDTVRFFTEEDGDYIGGSVGADKDIDKYAKFATSGIAADAFDYDLNPTRSVPITFVGPMKAGYSPYMFAIGKGEYTAPGKISKNEVYILYKTENPRNLSCSYVAEKDNATIPISPVNPVYVPIDSTDTNLRDKYSDELLSSVPHIDNKGKFVKPAGVYLLSYPNRTTYIDQGKAPVGVSVDTIDEKTGSDRTSMVSAIVDQTTDIIVPYGIDFIDDAESAIESDHPNYDYFTFDKGNSSLFSKGSSMIMKDDTETQKSYHMFAYVKGLKSVTFESGSAWYIPSYAFEGPYVSNPDVIVTDPTKIPQSIEKITFNQDVKLLGELPFYCPDPEDTYARGTEYSKTLPHNYRSPSQLETVNFYGESGGGKDNVAYSFTNGIIKSDNGNDVTVEEILPGRGFLYKISSTTIGDVDENGINELDGVTKFAPYAARDCDSITVVDLQATGADLPEGVFYDCDDLHKVTLPDSSINVKSNSFGAVTSALEVYCPEKTGQYRIDDDAFEPGNPLLNTKYPDVTLHYHKEAEALEKFATNKKLHPNVNPGDYIADSFQLAFNNIDGTRIATHTVSSGEKAISYEPPTDPVHPTDPSMVFEKWQGTYDADTTSTKFDVYYPLYEAATFIPVYGTGDKITITFVYDDDEFLDEVEIDKGKIFTEDMMPYYPQKYKGRTFSYISNSPVGKSFTVKPARSTVIHYEDSGSSSSSSTSSSGGGSTGGGGSTSGTSSSSSKSSSSSSSSSAYPVYVNSQDVVAPAAAVAPGIGSTVYVDEGTSSGSGSGSTGKKGSGNATVISTTGGISDTGKISATVNGSTDNYVIKITQTPEADEMGLAALHSAYGDDITPIRYLPFDISLYDSTGTNKISPVPEGVSISLTMPIPDDLAIYGGNAKIASTAGGMLEPMTPRFTVINGVPCMTYTCTHFSPYMVYVDTANLTEAGISDMTPKTADGIHPKWFLCFGLAALAVVMFLKKDPEEYMKKAA